MINVPIFPFLSGEIARVWDLWSSPRSRTGRPRPDRGRRRPHLAVPGESRGGMERWASPAKNIYNVVYPWFIIGLSMVYHWFIRLSMVYPWFIHGFSLVYPIQKWHEMAHNASYTTITKGRSSKQQNIGQLTKNYQHMGGLNQECLEFT